MKKLGLIILTLILTNSVFSQREGKTSFEPEKIKVAKTYKVPEKLGIDIIIKDNRSSSRLYSEKVIRSIAGYIKESYPQTNINFIKNPRKELKSEISKVVVKIDIVDYFVVRKANKWIAKTTIDLVVFDLRGNKIKRYKERVNQISEKPNTNAAQSAKLALKTSFKIALVKSIKYLETSIKGEGKFEYIDRVKDDKAELKADNKQNVDGNINDKKEPQFISDIDVNIPVISEKNVNRYALIIGNEDYNSYQKGLTGEVNVEFAEGDAKIFKEYATKTLGVPNENVILMINAQVVEFSKSIEKINAIIKNLEGEAEVIFYYAGHGFPDEETKEPYLIPVDVSGTDLKYAISLNDIYKKFTEYPSKRVTVFLDACFSGGARNQGLLAARGVKVSPKENLLKGNLVVFSASSGTQSSLPYKEQQHGLYTYFLLKKIQEVKGEISLSGLSNYLSKQVSVKSVMINEKEQNPQVNISPDIEDTWAEMKLK